MNAGMFFQAMGGTLIAGTSLKTSSTQTGSSFGNAGDSFKKEMDKAFDEVKSSAKNEKSETTDKTNGTSNRTESKTDVKQENVNETAQNVEDDTVILDEEQAAAAVVQLQQPVQVVVEQPTEMLTATAQVQTAETDGVEVINTQAEADAGLEIKGKEVLIGNDGKLVAQSSADLVKGDMLRAANVEVAAEEAPKADLDIIKNVQVETAETTDETAVKNLQVMSGEEAGLEQGSGEEQDQSFEGEFSSLKNTFDPSKYNVKVADAPIDTARADVAQQMADKIVYKLSEGKHEFDMELNPANLGKVNIKMIFENGSAEIIMTTSNAKAHQLLSAQTDALKAILEGTLGMNNNIEVKQAENTSEQFDRDNFQEQSERQQSQEQKREKKSEQDISFVERLRLGLTENRTEEFEWEVV